MIQALSFNLALKTSAHQFQASILSKATSDINVNGTQYKVPFCGLILRESVFKPTSESGLRPTLGS